MRSNTLLVSLVAAVLFLAVLSIANVSANGSSVSTSGIVGVEVKGVDVLDTGVNIASFAGETLPVKVIFKAEQDASDVRVKIWIAGERENTVSSERFSVFKGKTYSRLVAVPVASDLDLNEDLKLEVLVESKKDGKLDDATISLSGQRESYLVEILDVSMDSSVKVGERLVLDVVLKNRGLELAEDTFVRASIPSLGLEERGYFGDLSAIDEDDPDKEDASERRMFLDIPSNAKPGVYELTLEAFNSDSSTTLTRKLTVEGMQDESVVVASANSKSFAVDDSYAYSLTIVNSGSKVKLYNLVVDAADGLNVDVSEPVVVVPAGTSRTVKLTASTAEAAKYTFTASVSSDGVLVGKQSFTADVTGKKTTSIVAGGTNTTVLLTVVLAIIFVVLLVVLIVLLTRKPEKTKEFGESYY